MSFRAEGLVRQLQAAAKEAGDRFGVSLPLAEGKLLRPLVALAAAGESAVPREELTSGMLAIQLVHEASLLHDDILDDAARRRGVPSGAARMGSAAALVEGDHLLTAAYRLAHATDSMDFLGYFTRAVERTVAGEKAQHAARGRILTEAEYRSIVSAKSGCLFGAAVVLPACLREDGAPRGDALDRRFDMGCRIGRVYQMVDDFLDLCPGWDVGKPPLQDYRHGTWTWPMAEAGIEGFQGSEAELRRRLFGRDQGGRPAMADALLRLGAEVAGLEEVWAREYPGDRIVPELLSRWLDTAGKALAAELALAEKTDALAEATLVGPVASSGKRGRSVPVAAAEEKVRELAVALGGTEEWKAFFARHSRSFRFASRLLPQDEVRLVSGVYAFCRFTDDLVDGAGEEDVEILAGRLEAWAHLVRGAHRGEPTGISLLDEVMGETARRGVPVTYAQELIRGVTMDLEPGEFRDLQALRLYSYRVASVVGLWLAELFGVREPWVLSRAEAMGHAMQLTNIIRDVGEDLERGRLYLPLQIMAVHGVEREALEQATRRAAPLPGGYPALMEELMSRAEADYRRAQEGIGALPPFFARAVAVAGQVYEGIHREVRRNGYDNLTRRAYTSRWRKVALGARALRELGSRTHPVSDPAEEVLAAGRLPT
jgi:15-cis-phytoene synthase